MFKFILLLSLLHLFISLDLDAQQSRAVRSRDSPPGQEIARVIDGPDSNPISKIKVDSPLVLLSVTVTDDMSRIVTGLQKEHFRVKEDKVPQTITQFSAEDAPVTVGLIVDTSGSMGQKMTKAREAVAQFMRMADPRDEFFLICFDHRPRRVTGFTRDIGLIQEKLVYSQSKGRTALLDSVYLALRTFQGASHKRKALLLISDGGDNSSRYNIREVQRLVKEADVQIFSIGIFEGLANRALTPEELRGPDLLHRICEVTGGLDFAATNVNDLPDIVTDIGIALRNQYVVGYVPSNQQKDGKWRRLRLELKPVRGFAHLRAYARQGYYAPSE